MQYPVLTEHFEQGEIQNMEQPVITAVNSCRVAKYKDYHLAATPATYYYLNPKIPQADESHANKKVINEDGNYRCLNHGPQPSPAYKFRSLSTT
ncbi:hypothetical protein Tco_1381784, partial [Tanacetum coccineum]